MERSRPVVVLEFNELSPALMERFIAAGELPRFQRLHGESQAFVTEAEERYPYLEPWVQWITVHSGMNYREHGIHHLGEGHRLAGKRVWDVLSDAGRSSWLCGSMNAGLASPLRGAVLPDPWSPAVEPRPRALAPYFEFVSSMVHAHSQPAAGLALQRALRFAGFMAGHGLSAATTASVVAQLAEERLAARRGLDAGWKRACVLDRLQLDLFRSVWLRDRPDFATFFSNSTAHFQHWHWRNLEPGIFKVRPSDREQASYAGAVLHGYRRMDRLVGEVLDFCGDGAVVVLCTALSQQPCLVYEDEGGRVNYRPRDLGAFLARAGVGALAAEPVMDEQFRVRLAGEGEAERAEERLAGLTVNGRRLLGVRRHGSELIVGCGLHDAVPEGARAVGEGLDAPFFELFFRLPGMKSGMHHPDGLFWLRIPGCVPRVHSKKVRLDRVAPTLLGLLGLAPPETMLGAPLEIPRPGPRRAAA